MGFTAFQPNAFQRNAYQIVRNPANSNNWLGGGGNGYSWELTRHILDQRKAEADRVSREKAENARRLAAKEAEIARLEARRKADLANQAMQIELRDMLIQLRDLELKQAQLQAILAKIMRDEDDILVILLSLPFMA